MSVDAFSKWLGSHKFPVKPSLHINEGNTDAAVVVDFGSPLTPIEFTDSFGAELASRMRSLATMLTGRKNQRFNYDHHNGVFWTSTNYR